MVAVTTRICVASGPSNFMDAGDIARLTRWLDKGGPELGLDPVGEGAPSVRATKNVISAAARREIIAYLIVDINLVSPRVAIRKSVTGLSFRQRADSLSCKVLPYSSAHLRAGGSSLREEDDLKLS